MNQLRLSYSKSILGCTSGWTEFKKSCYKFFTSSVTWGKARDACLAQDSHLASVLSTEEQQFVTTIITSSYDDTWTGAKMGTFDFEWEDGNDFNYTNWRSGYPSYSGECIVLDYSYSGQWIDVACSGTQYYICKQSFV